MAVFVCLPATAFHFVHLHKTFIVALFICFSASENFNINQPNFGVYERLYGYSGENVYMCLQKYFSQFIMFHLRFSN